MTERFQAPFQRFFTTDIKTLPASLLYFYENGTTTPKTTYRDPFKNNAHDNPVVAGTHGAAADSFPPIFLDGTYTVLLKSAADVTQSGWPVDNVGGEQIQGQLDSYSSITSYSIGQLVTGSDGNRYESTANSNLNHDPTDIANRTTYWKQVFIIGEYVSTEAYGVGDYITYDGGLFKCVQAATGQAPQTAHAYWQRMHNIPHWGSTSTYRQYDLAIDSNGVVVVSQQNANINHNPVGDTTYTWWKPLSRVSLDANPQLIKINPMSGGGTLLAEWDNVILDGNAGYLLPLANSVAANTAIIISKSDIARTLYPIITASGADTIAWLGGTDTSFQIDTQFADSMILYSNGTNQWSF
jgi:hypothetical protein